MRRLLGVAVFALVLGMHVPITSAQSQIRLQGVVTDYRNSITSQGIQKIEAVESCVRGESGYRFHQVYFLFVETEVPTDTANKAVLDQNGLLHDDVLITVNFTPRQLWITSGATLRSTFTSLRTGTGVPVNQYIWKNAMPAYLRAEDYVGASIAALEEIRMAFNPNSKSCKDTPPAVTAIPISPQQAPQVNPTARPAPQQAISGNPTLPAFSTIVAALICVALLFITFIVVMGYTLWRNRNQSIYYSDNPPTYESTDPSPLHVPLPGDTATATTYATQSRPHRRNHPHHHIDDGDDTRIIVVPSDMSSPLRREDDRPTTVGGSWEAATPARPDDPSPSSDTTGGSWDTPSIPDTTSTDTSPMDTGSSTSDTTGGSW